MDNPYVGKRVEHKTACEIEEEEEEGEGEHELEEASHYYRNSKTCLIDAEEGAMCAKGEQEKGGILWLSLVFVGLFLKG